MTRDEIIVYLNANKLRGNTVLGWAQTNAPLAYQEYIDKANKMKGILYHLRSVGWNTDSDYNTDPNHLKDLFKKRHEFLRTQS